MAIPWPASPTIGQTFTYGGITYTWNGVIWSYSVTRSPGSVGSVAVTAPITNTGTPTAPVIGISQSSLTLAESQVTNLVTDLAGKASLASANTFTVGGHTINSEGTGVIGLIINQPTGTTANLAEFKVNNSNYARISGNGSIATASNLAVGALGITNANQLQVTTTSATNIGAVIRGTTSQSANLQEWQTTTPTTVASISSAGAFTATGITSSSSLSITGANSPINLPTGGNGTSGQYLGSTGSGTTPIWSTPALGKKIIQTITLSGTSAISFTSIPATYRDLEIRIITSTVNTTSTSLSLTVNGLSTNIYSYIQQYVNGVSPTPITYAQGSGATSALLTANPFANQVGSALKATIYDYASGAYKIGDVNWLGGPSAGTYFWGYGTFYPKLTAAITQVDITVGGTGGLNGTAVLIGVY